MLIFIFFFSHLAAVYTAPGGGSATLQKSRCSKNQGGFQFHDLKQKTSGEAWAPAWKQWARTPGRGEKVIIVIRVQKDALRRRREGVSVCLRWRKNIILYFSPITWGHNGLKDGDQFHPSAPIQYYFLHGTSFWHKCMMGEWVSDFLIILPLSKSQELPWVSSLIIYNFSHVTAK